MDLEDFEEGLKKVEAAIKTAEDTAGDTEIRDAIFDKAEYLLKHKKIDLAIETY